MPLASIINAVLGAGLRHTRWYDRDRFRGTCYRAANWIYVGGTQGGGKLDCRHRHPSPVKHVYVYLCPLQNDFRQKLHATAEP